MTKALSSCVLEEANCLLKKDKLSNLTRAQQTIYLNNWFMENKNPLDTQMGLGINNTFLTGILVLIYYTWDEVTLVAFNYKNSKLHTLEISEPAPPCSMMGGETLAYLLLNY